MKKLLIVLFISTLFIGCSNDTENTFQKNSDLSSELKSYMEKYEPSENLQRNTALYNQLDHSSNYENSIFYYITHDSKYDPNNTDIYSGNCGYSGHNQFDKDLIEIAVYELNALSDTDYFSKMDYLEDFVKNNVTNSLQKTYLLSSIEEFKWISYSVAAAWNFDRCLDNCMEDTIEDNLGDANWIEWAFFIRTAAATVAVWAASCIWDCA